MVWPVATAPIERGAILVGDDGRIAEVGPAPAVPLPEETTSLVLADSMILPGVVNAHTHLELTGFRGQIEEDDFFHWIQHVRSAKEAADYDELQIAARDGLREAWSFGVTCVADTGSTGAAAQAIEDLGGRGVVYQEVFGPDPAQSDASLAGLRERIQELRAHSTAFLRMGVSPHALYTVSAELFTSVAEYARFEGLPIAVHVAESHAETDLVARASGRFAEDRAERGLPPIRSARSPVEFLESTGILGPDLLAIHCVQISAEDIERLADAGVSVAVCANSNWRHGHGSPNPRALIDAGVTVGVGTDSVASVEVIDPFAEARALVHLGLSPVEVVECLTVRGAEALGWGADIGTLEKGKWADLCVLDAPRIPPEADAAANAVVGASSEALLATLVAGRTVYCASSFAEEIPPRLTLPHT